MGSLNHIINKYLLCPHNTIGGTSFGACPKCKSIGINNSEKSFNELLDKEHSLRVAHKKKVDDLIDQINRKNQTEREFRIKREEKIRKDEIDKKYKKNQDLIKNKLLAGEKAKLNYLLKLSPYDFEKEVAKMFELEGFKATVTAKSNDGGKDIILNKNGKVYLAECKRYNKDNKIGREALQKFFAAIYEYKAEGGYFITTSDFTSTAYEYPKVIDNKIKLINGEKLISAMKKIHQNHTFFENYTEVCLACGELVNFRYPQVTQSTCTKGHIVLSTVNSLKNKLGIR